MLLELRIRDYAVIEDLSLTLVPGLNVLTGETGAGKSIIVGALSLLLGERANAAVVRPGAERATVEAVFDVTGLPDVVARLEELGLEPDDGHLILRRVVAAEGRNRAWVNGSPATAGVVGELGSALVDLHGQHEHQTLTRAPRQRELLDAFAGAQGEAGRVRRLHRDLVHLRELRAEREARRREVAERADFLRFQLGEIEGAGVEAGEDERLEAEARRASHAEDLVRGGAQLHEALYDGDDSVADRLADLHDLLGRLSRLDPDLRDAADELDTARHAVVEVGRRMGRYADSVEHDPARLEEIRARLDALFRLKRKYGPELDDVLATQERVRTELAGLDEAAHDLAELDRRIGASADALAEAAGELTAHRAAAAGRLADAVEGLLPGLGMPGGRFEVLLDPRDEIAAHGAEDVEFRVAANPGTEPMPLARVASGGELSRIALALESVLAEVDAVPVLVFDEIDAGIGGVVATRVAARLEDVARRHQVFVVTHLAQIASRARGHLRVEKGSTAGLASAEVAWLEGDGRVEEIARMLGGDPESAASRDHARELLGAT